MTAPGAPPPRLSVVVPTHQRRGSVLRLLEALGTQTAVPALFEAIVAVDGSDDGTREAVEGYQAPFRVRQVWQPQHGRAAACNAGARLAMGDLLVFLDDDMEPAPGFVAAHHAAHASEGGAALGVVGAAPIEVAPDAPPVVRFRAEGFARKLDRLAARGEELAFNDVYTGNFSIRRDVFFAAGGYDEEFRLYGHEDYELALRLGRSGVRFVFDAAAVARQHYTKSFRALAANIAAEGETAVLFALKHPEVRSSLPLSGYAARSRRTRARLAALLALSRAYRAFPSHLIARVERFERRERPGAPLAAPALFARYRMVFDLLYWIGVERALGEAGGWRRVPFRDVEKRIAEAARTRGGLAGRQTRESV